MANESSGAHGPSFSSEEFIAAATRFFDTARPWLAAALAEHAQHPDAEPGTCRLCALTHAVAANVEPFATQATRSLGHFADEVLADLLTLAEELLGSAHTAFAAVAADYASTVRGGATPRADSPAATDSAAATGAPSSQVTGYESIEVQLSVDDPQDDA